jgi:hypothetical protein
MAKGNIYLICDMGHDNLYKIGRTKNAVSERIGELQTGNPDELFVIKEFETDAPAVLEGMLHRHFFSKKVLNEWFRLDDEDVFSFEETCEKYEGIMNALCKNPFFKSR